jgi:phosphate transport system substrate-binding protein
MKKRLTIITAIMLMIVATVSHARDQISIVGSSTVFPFSTAVAETFGKRTQFKTPVVESTGSGGGFKLFCAGVGPQHPDITNASRAVKKTELEMCIKNGVTHISEVKIGNDGIAIANSKKGPLFNLTKKDLFLALAKNVPDGNGNLIPNPYTTWKQIRSDLPDYAIEVLGPPPTSGTRDAFVEIAMEGGAKKFESLAALRKTDKKAFKAIAHTIREDGVYVESGENDNLIVQKLGKNPKALGIFGYSFLEENSSKVQGSKINGVVPTFETIADGTYSVSRALYFYVKHQHIGTIPGISEFVDEFVSEGAIGQDGYLADRGLVPLPATEKNIKLIAK